MPSIHVAEHHRERRVSGVYIRFVPESAFAGTAQHRHRVCLVVRHHQVGHAIAIDIRDRHRTSPRTRFIVGLRAEISSTAGAKDRYRPVAVVRHREVRPSVAVKVANREAVRTRARLEVVFCASCHHLFRAGPTPYST
jgi:hypothetical protein